MSETVALPELDEQYYAIERALGGEILKPFPYLLACRERQLLAAIARAELAEAKLAKRDKTIAELRFRLLSHI